MLSSMLSLFNSLHGLWLELRGLPLYTNSRPPPAATHPHDGERFFFHSLDFFFNLYTTLFVTSLRLPTREAC